MTPTRYWVATFTSALCGGFVAIERFAFAPRSAVWIAFGVAVAAVVLELAGFAFALAARDRALSGLSALSALLASWTIIATRTFTAPTALWLGFAGGVALLLISVRALALHATTAEQVANSLKPEGSGEPRSATRPSQMQPVAVTGRSATESLRRGRPLSAEMRSWTDWLTHTALALAGGFVVLGTYAWSNPGQPVSVRWLAFGVGVAASSVALSSLVFSRFVADTAGPHKVDKAAYAAAVSTTIASSVVALALVVTMAVLDGSEARWTAFGLASALVGISLLASAVNEFRRQPARRGVDFAGPAGASKPGAGRGVMVRDSEAS